MLSSSSTELIVATALGGLSATAISCIWHLLNDKRSVNDERSMNDERLCVDTDEHLHWDPLVERRGLGNLIHKANHIAIIVSDVGRSAAWYSEVLGLQQIRRPNFDRHGAWFTMGNLELHLIKGEPLVHSAEDLIVGHISLECDPARMDEVRERLDELGVDYRQNISVPDPEKSRAAIFEGTEENMGSSDVDGQMAPVKPTTGVTQFFLRDPDGYFIEVCNCDLLTKFCLCQEDADLEYDEAAPQPQVALAVTLLQKRWRRKVQQRMRALDDNMDGQLAVEEVTKGIERASQANEAHLTILMKRTSTHGDITQGFSEDEFREALQLAGNDIRTAIFILTIWRGDDIIFQPPAFIEDGKLVKPPVIVRKRSTRSDTCVPHVSTKDPRGLRQRLHSARSPLGESNNNNNKESNASVSRWSSPCSPCSRTKGLDRTCSPFSPK